MGYFNVINLLTDVGDNKRKDIEESKEGIDDDDIDFELTVQVTVGITTEMLSLKSMHMLCDD